MIKRYKKFDKGKIKRLAQKYKSDLLLNRTNAEKVFAYILDKIGVGYKEQYIIYVGTSFYIVDFYLPKYKVIFEVDGVHHYTTKGAIKDKKRDNTLATLGFTVKRIRNKEVYSPRKCEKRIKGILGMEQNKFF